MAEPLAGTDRLIEVTLDDSALPPASPEAEQDRRVALYELTQENVFGLPGRATGGPVSPGRAFVVGERGPEVFVPTSAGRIENAPAAGHGRDVRVAIQLAVPRGQAAPTAMQRSSRQIASAVRRALQQY